MASSAIHNHDRMRAATADLYNAGAVIWQVFEEPSQKEPATRRTKPRIETRSPAQRTRRSRIGEPIRRFASSTARVVSLSRRVGRRGVTAL